MTASIDSKDRTKRESRVLAFNSGSSSLKFGLYRVDQGRADSLVSGEAGGIGQAPGGFHARDGRGQLLLHETVPLASQAQAIARIGRLLADLGTPAPQAIGHRIVHGGPALRRHCRIDAAVLRELEAATPFAPLHTPAALEVIRYAHAHFAGLAQVACFDTVFHASMPDVARVLPIPRALRARGLQRYGFHGLSCESIVRQLAAELPSRLIIAHLGNGASVTAVKDGVSIDTSMGLTPSGGLIMGTRSGDLDPGVLVYLARERQFDAVMLEDLVDHRSGLLGISGLSADMRSLHEAAASNPDAQLAIRMFCQAVRKQIAAMSVVLDGAEMIVFTGGIGQNDAQVRADICAGLSTIGVQLDESRNRAAGNPVSSAGSSCQVRVLPSLEDDQIALHAWALQ
ncbi:MAG: acetate/propionate family kinase [Pseudomonadota bacterium]|nr:acetate/propionate family kinase [Pseudomonadota bacterium]